MRTSKKIVAEWWDQTPCGSTEVQHLPEGSRDYFDALEQFRYGDDDHLVDVVDFPAQAGKQVLEVGCGLGADLLQFARHGASVSSVDLSLKSLQLTQQRLGVYGVSGALFYADGENLPFRDNGFDFVYSWGVIHHTVDPARAAREITRVCKKNGRVLVMVYNRLSLVALQAWLRYGLLRGRPWRSFSDVLAAHMESPGTRAYTRRQAREMFADLTDVSVRTVVTRYDLRVGRRRFLPRWLRKLVPSSLGWFMIIQGTKK